MLGSNIKVSILSVLTLIIHPGGTPRKFGWGFTAPFLKLSPYFRLKFCDLPHLILDLNQIKPFCLRKHLRNASMHQCKFLIIILSGFSGDEITMIKIVSSKKYKS